MPLYWEDAEDIAEALREAHPEEDPRELCFPTLHRLVCELPDFADEPGRSSEGKLDAILMAWVAQAAP